MADLVKDRAKGEARDEVLEKMVKFVFGETAASVSGVFLFLSDPVVAGDGSITGPVSRWKQQCDAFSAREEKRDDYLIFLTQQREEFSNKLKTEQLKPQEADVLREAIPIVDTIIREEQAEKKSNAKARFWCERFAPEAALFLNPRSRKSHPIQVLPRQ
jgi:dsDNA-binding SOS-regulon protein